MKILFYNHTGQVSGAERLLLMVLERLDRKSFDPIVVCPSAGELRELAIAAGVRTKPVKGLQARFTWRPDRLVSYLKSFAAVLRDLRQRVITVDPDLIHANSIRAGLVATAATIDLGTPVVWHLHDELPRHPISSAIRIFAALSRRTRMIAVSQSVSTNFCGRLSRVLKWRVSVILNAVDLERFKANVHERGMMRELLGVTGAEPVLGIVGQVTPRKGQLELIRAFARALPELPKAVLLIAGAPLFNRDQEYADRVAAEAAALGIADRVRMLGARRDVPAIMRTLDLLIVNSVVEPFGLVGIEAMACGTPVLTTAVGGLKEIVTHGETGWLVNQGNEEELAAAIVSLSRQPEVRAQLSEKARRNLPRFSADRYLDELQTFYCACGTRISPISEMQDARAGSELARAGSV